jgi:very-short-patch-repair endonuclease
LAEIELIGHMPITSVRRTLFDIAGLKHPRTEAAMDEALTKGMTSLSQLWLYHDHEWMRGRRGIAIIRDLLIPRTRGLAPADSDLEIMMCELLEQGGLPLPVRQFAVELPSGHVHIDLAYPDLLMAIELDGYAWHSDKRSFERDRQRDNELRALGWTVFRFTWSMVRFDPHGVLGLVRAHIDRCNALSVRHASL